MAKGEDTRRRILDIAQDSILAKGFGATSIEEIIAEAGLTKSGFFYHFRDKNELAKALLHRFVEDDTRIMDDVFGRGRALMDDPLHGFLLGLKFLADTVADLPNGHPGCLVATACYNERLFDREVQEINREAALRWRARFRAHFDEILERYELREPLDVDQLADMVSTVLEGGIVMAKALREPRSLERQILLFRSLVRVVFVPR
jgi:TetR/AcrR family transcriptional repressor of nem operon